MDPAQPHTEAWRDELRRAAAEAEQQVRRAVVFLNDRVVPQARREGIALLRSAAEELRRAADRLEHGAERPGTSENPRA